MKYTVFDAALFSQKLVLCLLLSTGIDEFGSLVVTLSHSMLVFLLWLRLRPHRHPHMRSIAMLLFSCVIGLQVYSLVSVAGLAPLTVAQHGSSSSGTWHRGFSTAVFCFVVCCMVYCLASVGWITVKVIQGPVMMQRQVKSMHKSQLSHGLWVAELGSYSVAGKQLATASSAGNLRQSRVSSIMSVTSLGAGSME